MAKSKQLPIQGEADLARYVAAKIKEESGADPVWAAGSFWRFDSGAGIWSPMSELAMQAYVQSFHRGARKLLLDRRTSENAIAILRAIRNDPDFFNHAPKGLTFANGFIRASLPLQLLPHDPNHRSRRRAGFDFVPGLVPSATLRFLLDVFEGDSDRSSKVQILREFFGSCLLGIAPQFERAFVLLGRRGRNGKSILIDAVSAFFPDRTAVEPAALTDQYYRYMLIGSRINIIGELPKKDILDPGTMKGMISGQEMTGRDLRQSPVAFRSEAGQLFACNGLPPVQNPDDAFFRRFVVITFNRTYDGFTLRDELLKPMISEEGAFVSWAVEGAMELLKRGNYEIPWSSAAAVERWSRRADQVAAFLDDVRIPGAAPSGFAYGEYKHWCFLTGHQRLSLPNFVDRLAGLGIETTTDVVGFGIRARVDWPCGAVEQKEGTKCGSD